VTWSAPRQIASTGTFQQIVGSKIMGNPHTGELYHFFTLVQWYDNAKTNLIYQYSHYMLSRSTDGGQTWSTPVAVLADDSDNDYDTNTGAFINDTTGLDWPAIDLQTGRLYLVFQDTDYSPRNKIELSSSTDDGYTWSPPALISTATTVEAMLPAIAVNPVNGEVAVAYDDVRTLTTDNKTTMPVSSWITVSPRGGGAFMREQSIAPPFDDLLAPNFFVGWYQGLIATPSGFRTLWVVTNAGPGGSDASHVTNIVTNQFQLGYEFDAQSEYQGWHSAQH
jgi:hypothetical protein